MKTLLGKEAKREQISLKEILRCLPPEINEQ